MNRKVDLDNLEKIEVLHKNSMSLSLVLSLFLNISLVKCNVSEFLY